MKKFMTEKKTIIEVKKQALRLLNRYRKKYLDPIYGRMPERKNYNRSVSSTFTELDNGTLKKRIKEEKFGEESVSVWPGIYCIGDKQEKARYIGKSFNDVMKRLRKHYDNWWGDRIRNNWVIILLYSELWCCDHEFLVSCLDEFVESEKKTADKVKRYAYSWLNGNRKVILDPIYGGKPENTNYNWSCCFTFEQLTDGSLQNTIENKQFEGDSLANRPAIYCIYDGENIVTDIKKTKKEVWKSLNTCKPTHEISRNGGILLIYSKLWFCNHELLEEELCRSIKLEFNTYYQ